MLHNRQYLFLAVFVFFTAILFYFLILATPSSQRLNVQLLWQENKLACESTFRAGTDDKTWFVEQLQFFISDIQFGSKKSGWQSARLVSNPYQTDDSVLLGTDCRTASQQANTVMQGNWAIEFETNAEVTDSRAIRFTLGVPFAVNHLNPISQPSPLNFPSMFWVWQTGHKFMRLELATNHEQWVFHLGSTGCHSSSVMRGPKQACRYANTFTFEVPINVAAGGDLTLNFDLAALLNHLELTSLSSCQSERDKASCQQLFANLSLAAGEIATEPSLFKVIKTHVLDERLNVE